ncbi:MAG TPA: type II toxin-antitoxin system VapC family toxin [Candidatus Acidoferrales bacterium]|jgi:hypothetical protein|nr:type II toxin-antitoxin system VapC family toxin [Candidatus Acidoferrales bacterium]
MIILDTNVLSEMMRERPDRRVMAWLNRQPQTSVWITSVTILEIHFGLELLGAGNQRAQMTKALEALLVEDLGNRVAPFDTAAAQNAAILMASRRRAGRPVELRDTLIAGVALARHATIATRNSAHFEDLPIPVVNPWTI